MENEITRNMEDYLETIYMLSKDKGCARVKDIADRLCVKPASVSEMLQKLDKRKYLVYEKYGKVMLTEKGKISGKAISTRHKTLKEFLKIILVPDDAAERDACIIEHNILPKTLEQIAKLVEFMKHCNSQPIQFKDFRSYCKTGNFPDPGKRTNNV